MLEVHPALTGKPGALRSLLLSWADPTGLPSAGAPYVFGHGRLALPNAILSGYQGVCELTPEVPQLGSSCVLEVSLGLPSSPLAVVVDLDAQPVQVFGSAALHVGTVAPQAIVGGLGFFGPIGSATLSSCGDWSRSVTLPSIPLNLPGIHIQAAWLNFGGIVLTTPVVLDL